MRNDILFLTLKVFSATGGIEKVCRIAGKAMVETCMIHNKRLRIFSMHDHKASGGGNVYFPLEIFTGFGVSKSMFMIRAVQQGRQSRLVILSHINLLLAGWLIKKLNPSVKVVLFAHGIEVWSPLPRFKKKMLDCCDEIVSVSEFTQRKMVEVLGVDPSKCLIMNNCLDPFLPLPKNIPSKEILKKKYGFSASDQILFTLSRLSARERYKGYDKVMEAMLQINDPNVKYLIAGRYDDSEKIYIDTLIRHLKLDGKVVLAGFIPDEEVAAHFAMADCYVMPSVKEGFGIVFIEAMYYGLPVIAGNADGSVDALQNGQLGLLVNPASVVEIKNGIQFVLGNKEKYMANRQVLMAKFSYDSYQGKMDQLLLRLLNPDGSITANV